MKKLNQSDIQQVPPQSTPMNRKGKRVQSDIFNITSSCARDSSQNFKLLDPSVQKKTRNLPNFNECHACSFRVDINDGKNRLQILYSEWRVVLLCKKCFASVESAQICSYCFVGSYGECFICSKCKRSIHKVCVLNHMNSAPWSFSYAGSEFSICVDCWIPKSVDTSRRLLKHSKIKKKPRLSLGNQNSGGLDNLQNSKCLEDLVKDAKNDAVTKVGVAARAREEAVKKALEARRAVELASDALNTIRKEASSNGKMNGKEGVNNLVDDVDLAVQLHQAINCSPRISKTHCLLNTSGVTILRTLESSNRLSTILTYSRRPRASKRSNVCKNKNLCENLDTNASELSVSVNALDCDSSTDAICLAINEKIDVRTGVKDEGCREDPDAAYENGEATLKGGEMSCSNKLLNLCREDSSLEFYHKQENSTIVGEERFFFLKYKRKGLRKALAPDDGAKILTNNKSFPGSLVSAAGTTQTLNCHK